MVLLDSAIPTACLVFQSPWTKHKADKAMDAVEASAAASEAEDGGDDEFSPTSLSRLSEREAGGSLQGDLDNIESVGSHRVATLGHHVVPHVAHASGDPWSLRSEAAERRSNLLSLSGLFG